MDVRNVQKVNVSNLLQNDIVLTYIFVEQNQRKMNINATGNTSIAGKNTKYFIIGFAIFMVAVLAHGFRLI